ncbi:MAG: hypothetical protein IJW45_08360 [Oscillospiraceae bacterium]|nr:hypothetical protein [Oscillospiraceae bacterium]
MDEKTIETVMEAVCELCHWPYVETDQEQLEERCAACPVERCLKEVGS